MAKEHDWLRVRMHLSRSNVAQRLASLYRGDAQKAAGVLVDFWSSVSDEAHNGYIRDYPDHALDTWAGWKGKRGVFAAWVRAHHMDPDGRVKDWDEYMGALESRRESDRERKELERLRKKAEEANGHADGPTDIHRTSRGRSAPARARTMTETFTGTETNQPTASTTREETPGEIAFLAAVPGDRRNYWRAIIGGWCRGQGYPQGRAADPRDVDAGLLEYLAAADLNFSPRHVRAFVTGAEKQRIAGGHMKRTHGRQRSLADEAEANALAGALAIQQRIAGGGA